MGRPRKTLEPTPPVVVSRAASLVASLRKNSDVQDNVYCASDLMNNWRYIDFCNPMYKLPCIALEWEFGGRGLLAGRIVRLLAKYGVGKSAFMWLMYACGQQPHLSSFCYHIETEGAPPPPDFIASFGCNPQDLAMQQPRSLENCFELIDEAIASIRGGFGGSIDPETGRKKKTAYTEPIDKDMVSPIVAGVDSFSGLGLEARVQEDVLHLQKSNAMAEHSRKVAEYLRDRSDRFKSTQTLIMLAAQEKVKIKTGPTAGWGGPESTSLGDSPIGFHATYCIEMSAYKYTDKDTGADIGSRIMVYTEKNKLSPKHRTIELYLVRDKGFDLIHTDAEFLIKHQASPLKGVAERTAHGIKCPALSDKSFKSEEEFVRAFYANTDLLQTMREAMRIRGYGFDFETKYYGQTGEEPEDPAEIKAEGEADGVAGSQGPVPTAG